MKLDFHQAQAVIRAIDLRETAGREIWKRMLHTPEGTMADLVNQFIADGDEYLHQILATQVAKRMSK